MTLWKSWGEPTGIADDVDFAADEAAAAAPTEVADDARGAPDKAAASESKRRRIVGKRHSAGHASASHVVPRGDDADAATATIPATVYCAENGAAPANNAQPATVTPLAEVASATQFMQSRWLFLKSEDMCRRVRLVEADQVKYQVAWENALGRGTFGTVFPGMVRGVAQQAVAIKMFQHGSRSEQARNVDREVRRYVTLPSHPHIAKLLDVVVFLRLHGPPAIGLVFERFDTDVRQFLKLLPLKVSGMRHVLRCVCAALSYMHELGLVHADLQPANVLLREAGAFQDGWRRLLGRATGGGADSASGAASASGADSLSGSASVDEPLEVFYNLQASFEVCCWSRHNINHILAVVRTHCLKRRVCGSSRPSNKHILAVLRTHCSEPMSE